MANGFIYINEMAFPYPDKDSGLQTIATLVSSSRTADGVLRGEKIGRDQSKIELTWNVLTPEIWSSMLRQFDNFTFKVNPVVFVYVFDCKFGIFKIVFFIRNFVEV